MQTCAASPLSSAGALHHLESARLPAYQFLQPTIINQNEAPIPAAEALATIGRVSRDETDDDRSGGEVFVMNGNSREG